MKKITYLILFTNFLVFAQTVRGVISRNPIRGVGDRTELRVEQKKPSFYAYTYSDGVSLLELVSEQGTTIDTAYVVNEKIKDTKFETMRASIKPHKMYYYKNFNTNVYRLEASKKNRNLVNIETSIKDTIPAYKWSLENVNQTIAGYDCKKANTIKTVGARAINITAWYCEDLPINDGPMDYSGLPGMILQIEVEKNTIIKFEKLKYFKNENTEIKEPDNETEMITIQEYIKKQYNARQN